MSTSETRDGILSQRRRFLQGATLAGAAAIAPVSARAQSGYQSAPAAPAAEKPEPVKGAPAPNQAAETLPPSDDPVNQASSGGEFMVDVLKSIGFDFIAINPASSFRGLHEALINYGGNKSPEILTCTHEEIAVAMAHGYAKMEGKPMCVLTHGTVGLQHASMALYNAFCDKVPVFLMIGNIVDADKRSGTVEWAHSAQDPAALARDFLKWDDQPGSLQHFAESAVRAYKFGTSAPMAPTLLSLDCELQENPIKSREDLHIPKLPRNAPSQGDSGAVKELGRMLVSAENPVIVVDRMARTQAGMDSLVQLAELLQCAVIDKGGRTNFPTRHKLNQNVRALNVTAQADVILGVELNDFWGSMNSVSDRIVRTSAPVARQSAKIVSLGMHDTLTRANYQEFERYPEVDLAITGDGEATLPALIEAVRTSLTDDRKSALQARGGRLGQAHDAAIAELQRKAAVGWDASPITTARLCAEIYNQIRDEDWSLVGEGVQMLWPRQFWNATKRSNFNGNSGGFGIGYSAPAALGAALANKRHGRLSVAIQGDGDLMFTPGVLWTAAHHRIPLLYVMHNNRAYHQEYMYVQDMTGRLNRGIRNAHVGTTMTDPNIDFATVAKGFGVYAEGPITDPAALGPALTRAIAVVKEGRPALLDTIVEPR